MKTLERRICRLESVTHLGADIDRAHAILAAYDVVNHHPEQATDADRALVAATSWEEWNGALIASIQAAGGLEAVLLEAIAIQAARKEGQS